MAGKSKIKNKLLIFDLDGTLYRISGGSFKKSPLKRAVWAQALEFIRERLLADDPEAKQIFKKIRLSYGENISLGLEKEFGISRYEYFDFVWDLPARKFIEKNPAVKAIIARLARNNKIIILSDAPKIWVIGVLKELGIYGILQAAIRSGEGDSRKIFGNAFEPILQEFNVKPADCVVIGDQEETDIKPAKKVGLKAIFIGKNQSRYADSTISNISEVEAAINNIYRMEP